MTVFSNPHCKACAEMHKALSMLINNSKGIKLQYIFTSLGKNNEQDCLFLIESFIKDKLSFPELLDKWYASGRKHHYSNLPKESFKDDTINQYYSHTRCFDRCQFHMTPVVLLNGFALPRGYPILELQYLDFSSIHMGREG